MRFWLFLLVLVLSSVLVSAADEGMVMKGVIAEDELALEREEARSDMAFFVVLLAMFYVVIKSKGRLF